MRYFSFILLCLICIASLFGYYIYVSIHRYIEYNEQELEEVRHIARTASGVPPATQSPVMFGKHDVWRAVQDEVTNAVVQVCVQMAEVDMLQPYRTPTPYPSFGSGFFINEQGDIITNAHVVAQAVTVWIHIPALGKRIINVEVIGVSPERDLALLRVVPEDMAYINSALGKISYLELGDSDTVRRADEVMALGYPLAQQSLKSTTGVISGRERQFIQMSAPINPGNSGGPLLNLQGKVVGINSAGITEAQNVGYIIPINDLKIVLKDLDNADLRNAADFNPDFSVKLVRKPYLGVVYQNSNDATSLYLNNPEPGGCYITEVVEKSTLYAAGVRRGDMLYSINGNRVDLYGEMTVPWSDDKISVVDYVSRLAVGDPIEVVLYRQGQKLELSVSLTQAELPPVRKVYPGYEPIDYEIFGGMVFMPLTLNHVQAMRGSMPGLNRYIEMKQQAKPTLLVTHIFPGSQVHRARAIERGMTINEVNGIPVGTLDELRVVMKQVAQSEYITLRATDHVACISDNIFIVIPTKPVLEEERRLSRENRYPISPTMTSVLKRYEASRAAASQGKSAHGAAAAA